MKNLRYVFLILLAIFFSSCEDVLDRKPLDKISEADVWKNEAMMNSFVTNLYSRFPFFEFNTGMMVNSDEASESGGNSNVYTTGSVSRTSEGGSAYWDYAFIRDCNIFLDKVKDSPIKVLVANQLEGEVRFIRAYAYFEMQKRYGGVPLVDIVIDPFITIDKKYTKRSTEEAIADFIYAELTKAISLLSTDPLPKGKINKWTAFSLQARAMLWSASIAKYGKVELNGLVGITQSRADEFYTRALIAADSVILSGKYSLYNKYPDDKVLNYRNIIMDEENSEIIFEKPFDGVNIGHNFDVNSCPKPFTLWGYGPAPTLEFVLGYENIDGSSDQPVFGESNLYNNGYAPFINKDPRLLATAFFQGDAWLGTNIQTYEGLDPNVSPTPSSIISNIQQSYNGVPTVGVASRLCQPTLGGTATGFISKKYIVEKIIEMGNQSYTNWIVFRLAEMYLTKAEVEFELGNLQKSADALNQTRERVGISLVDENSITIEKIRNERRVELAFENHRFWDLIRWRISESVLNHRFQGLRIIFHYASGKYYFLPLDCELFSRVFRPHQYYNPITDSRINNNPDLVENPLY